MVFQKGHKINKGRTAWNKGRTWTEQEREKIKLSLNTEEVKQKLHNAQIGNKKWLGKKHSEETKRKMSLSAKGKIVSPETRRKLSKILKNVMKGKGNPFYGKKHTKETREKNRLAHLGKVSIKGEKHYNWKGGITPENVKVRTSIEYNLWRNSVFARDCFTCQKYGIIGGSLVAHHIRNFAEAKELRFAIDNGITLSKKAHQEFHKKYGKKNNTREQLDEFLYVKY